mmetsp:Transcript_4030/g.14138  ORF Transcript_4030/g.14138 Transcript_4030/m.14138 type:complete len:202 (-) Transcript_4030:222-827(-)
MSSPWYLSSSDRKISSSSELSASRASVLSMMSGSPASFPLSLLPTSSLRRSFSRRSKSALLTALIEASELCDSYFALASALQTSSLMLLSVFLASFSAWFRFATASAARFMLRWACPRKKWAFRLVASILITVSQSATTLSQFSSFLLHSALLTSGTHHVGHSVKASVYRSIAAPTLFCGEREEAQRACQGVWELLEAQVV